MMQRQLAITFFFALLGVVAPQAQAEIEDPLSVSDVELGSDADVCINRGTVVFAQTRRHALFLCEENRARGAFQIRIGRSGSGKTMQGDRKTPIGRYRLGKARASDTFVVFIPILYPTAEQVAMGFTGTTVGLHGPSANRVTVSPTERTRDWTDGCIAVDTPQEIQTISEWVRRRAPLDIVVE